MQLWFSNVYCLFEMFSLFALFFFNLPSYLIEFLLVLNFVSSLCF